MKIDSEQNSIKNSYRVAVIGGGPAGCATALELARRGVQDVLIVEAGNYDTVRIGESIPPDTRLLLERLGVWEGFQKEGHNVCYGSCSAWGSNELGYNDFLFNPLGNGWHLDRRRFDSFMAGNAAARGAHLMTSTRLECVERNQQGKFRVSLTTGASEDASATMVISADYVVDATGIHALVAKRLGAQQVFLDRLICVYGFMEPAAAERFPHITMLEGVESGWWYAARLPDERLAVAYASDPELIKQQGANSPDGWWELLRSARHIAGALAGYRYITSSLKAWPARSFVLDKAAGDGWFAVGDAASAYDPISSQGIHKALAGGIHAAKALAEQMAGNTEAGNEYDALVKQGFEGYVRNRNYFYGLEQRWPESLFWQRRQERVGV